MTAYGAILGSPTDSRHIGQAAGLVPSWGILDGQGPASAARIRPQLPNGRQDARQDARQTAVQRAWNSPLPSRGIAGYESVSEGETVLHLCGCGVWQGPRPWLGEGPAWAR